MNLGVDHPKAAIVAIDLHRGHLDMAVATMPTSPDGGARVIAANARLFGWCRAAGIPFWRTRAEDPAATRKNVLRHNLLGGPAARTLAA